MENQPYSCVIVDDDQLILLKLEILIEEIPWLKLLNKYTNPVKAATGIFEQKPDLVLLDIEMPYVDGYEWLDWISPKLDLITPRPEVVIISSSPERLKERCSQPILSRIYKPDLIDSDTLAKKIQVSLNKR